MKTNKNKQRRLRPGRRIKATQGGFLGVKGKGEQVRGSVTWGQRGSQCKNLNKGAEWTLGLGNMNVTGEEELSVI